MNKAKECLPEADGTASEKNDTALAVEPLVIIIIMRSSLGVLKIKPRLHLQLQQNKIIRKQLLKQLGILAEPEAEVAPTAMTKK